MSLLCLDVVSLITNNYTRKETIYESAQKSPLIIVIVTMVKMGITSVSPFRLACKCSMNVEAIELSRSE